MEVLDKTYFEINASEFLKNAHLTKAAFAEKMGVMAQNVKKVFETKNVCTLMKAADILGTSLDVLISGKEQTDNRINGFVEIDGTIHRVHSKQDLLNLIELL